MNNFNWAYGEKQLFVGVWFYMAKPVVVSIQPVRLCVMVDEMALGLYPALIIAVVELKRSIQDTMDLTVVVEYELATAELELARLPNSLIPLHGSAE